MVEEHREQYGRRLQEGDAWGVFEEWRRLHPGEPIENFTWWVRKLIGRPVFDIFTPEETERFGKMLSPDPMMAEGILEGLSSGP